MQTIVRAIAEMKKPLTKAFMHLPFCAIRWQPWRKCRSKIEETLRFFSTKDQPINTILTLKVGATYIKNVLYHPDHGETYADPVNIHSKGALVNSALTRPQVAEDVSFFVTHNPVNRFFSLYFDKILETSSNAFACITQRLTEHRGFRGGNQGHPSPKHLDQALHS
ncbi:MAG: sulfotransferase family 2 domain-containing protein [Paracoccaceae bacterium]